HDFGGTHGERGPEIHGLAERPPRDREEDAADDVLGVYEVAWRVVRKDDLFAAEERLQRVERKSRRPAARADGGEYAEVDEGQAGGEKGFLFRGLRDETGSSPGSGASSSLARRSASSRGP